MENPLAWMEQTTGTCSSRPPHHVERLHTLVVPMQADEACQDAVLSPSATRELDLPARVKVEIR
jgi:hypothetical protein